MRLATKPSTHPAPTEVFRTTLYCAARGDMMTALRARLRAYAGDLADEFVLIWVKADEISDYDRSYGRNLDMSWKVTASFERDQAPDLQQIA